MTPLSVRMERSLELPGSDRNSELLQDDLEDTLWEHPPMLRISRQALSKSLQGKPLVLSLGFFSDALLDFLKSEHNARLLGLISTPGALPAACSFSRNTAAAAGQLFVYGPPEESSIILSCPESDRVPPAQVHAWVKCLLRTLSPRRVAVLDAREGPLELTRVGTFPGQLESIAEVLPPTLVQGIPAEMLTAIPCGVVRCGYQPNHVKDSLLALGDALPLVIGSSECRDKWGSYAEVSRDAGQKGSDKRFLYC